MTDVEDVDALAEQIADMRTRPVSTRWTLHFADQREASQAQFCISMHWEQHGANCQFDLAPKMDKRKKGRTIWVLTVEATPYHFGDQRYHMSMIRSEYVDANFRANVFSRGA